MISASDSLSVSREFDPVVSLIKKLCPRCLVLIPETNSSVISNCFTIEYIYYMERKVVPNKLVFDVVSEQI